jgi:hypothetical protein
VTFAELLAQHGAYSLEKQGLLESFLGEHRWDLDLMSGTVDFGGGRVFRPQILGTESSVSNTWLWAWANKSVPEALTVAARSLRELGEAGGPREFRDPEVSLVDLDTHALGMVASGVLACDAYYLAHHPDGAVLLLLSAPELGALRSSSVTYIASYFTSFISGWEVSDQCQALASYLRAKGLSPQVHELSLTAVQPDGTEVSGSFDEQGRLIDLTIKLSGGGSVAP